MTTGTQQSINDLLGHADPDARRLAAEQLGEVGGLSAVSALAAALKDENKGVRDAAFRSLGSIGGERVARAVVENICDDNIVTRNLTGNLLLQLGPTSVPALLPFLTEASHDVRKFAVDILGIVGTPDLTDAIVPLLNDYDPNVIVSAAEALGNLRSRSAVPTLMEFYRQHEEYRISVAEALTKIAEPATAEFLLEEFRKELDKQPQDPILVYTLAESLGGIGTAVTLESIERNLRRVTGTQREAFVESYVKIANRIGQPIPATAEWQEHLLALLSSRSDESAVQAVGKFAAFPSGEVTHALVRALGRSPMLNPAISEALQHRPDCFLVLVNELEAGNVRDTVEAIRLLGVVAETMVQEYPDFSPDHELLTRAFNAAEAEWNGGNEELRDTIMLTLFRLEGDRALSFVDQALNEPDPWLRVHIIEQLARMTDPRIPQLLVKFVNDEDEMVREVAAGMLADKGFAVDSGEAIH